MTSSDIKTLNFCYWTLPDSKMVDTLSNIMQYSNFVRFVLYDFKYANPAELPLGRWTEPFYPDEESNIDYNIFYKEFSKTKKKDIENLKKYLQKFKKAVEENGAELIILQIPTKEQVHFKFFNEVINEFKIDVDKLDMDAPNKIIADLSPLFVGSMISKGIPRKSCLPKGMSRMSFMSP